MSEERELSLEEQDAQEQQAYAEALVGDDEARTDEVPTEETASPEVESEQPVVEGDPGRPIFAGLTEGELKEKLAKIDEIDRLRAELSGETRKVYGKVGELNGELKQLRELQKRPQTFGPDAMKRLQEEYPELAEILSASGEVERGRSTEDMEREFTERLQSAIGEQSAKVEMKILTVLHHDWQQVRDSAEFDAWTKTLPLDKWTELENSSDALHVANGLTEFKAWREENRKQQEATAEAERQKQDKRTRLEAAAQPAGVAPSATQGVASEEEAYQQAIAEGSRLRRRR